MEEELTRRASSHVEATQLTFSCYRIRRRFCLPLPIMWLPSLDVRVRGFTGSYPWQIWCLWALEERLYALNAAARYLGDGAARRHCVDDLEALAQWPRYSVDNKLDLPYAHGVHLLATALREWNGVPEHTQGALRAALHRAVAEGVLLVPAEVRDLGSSQELLARPKPHQYLHNIPLIAQAALATAAEAIGHRDRKVLSERFLHLYQARLGLSQEGLTEGISYDGYLANSALAWASTQPADVAEVIVHNPAMHDLEKKAYGLACPGAIWHSAEIGDVEPREMAFVWSALTRLQRWNFSASREALLALMPPERLRSDALWLRSETGRPQRKEAGSADQSLSGQPVADLAVPAVQRNSAAIALATGVAFEDFSVVMSLRRSPMNHIQWDNGTILIGHAGFWWITDPGYQQYLQNSEREFTVGPAAHNAPIINGHAQVHKAARLLYSGQQAETEAFAVVDITACYPAEAQVEIVTRTLWRLSSEHVVVCDTVLTTPDAVVQYNWHGNAAAHWGEQNGAVTLYMDECHRALWIQSGQQSLSLALQHRLRGSRGPCTLQVEQPAVTHHWWSFSLGAAPPVFEGEDTEARVGNTALNLADTLVAGTYEPQLEVIVHRDQLQVLMSRGDEPLAPGDGSGWSVLLEVNGQHRHSQTTRGRQLYMPIPALKADESVTLKATPLGKEAASGSLERTLTARERREVRSIPLRVYAEVRGVEVTGRCELTPDALEGEVEYAFYLLVKGQKTQVRWYEPSPEHRFRLSAAEAGQPIQIRGFARAVNAPQQKLSAFSAPVATETTTES